MPIIGSFTLADPGYTLTCQISSRSVSSVDLVGENHNFAVFWTSAFSGVTIGMQQSEKAEHGCTTTNLPVSNGIKIVSVLQRLHVKSDAQTPTFKSVTNKQTDRQTDKTQRFLAAPAVGEI